MALLVLLLLLIFVAIAIFCFLAAFAYGSVSAVTAVDNCFSKTTFAFKLLLSLLFCCSSGFWSYCCH
jgi:hypothetical protein